MLEISVEPATQGRST